MPRSNTRSVPDEPQINNICQILKVFNQARRSYCNITSFPLGFLFSGQLVQLLCEIDTRHFVWSRRTCSEYPGKRPFGLSENIFEIHPRRSVLHDLRCRRRLLVSPFRWWQAPFFSFLHGELSLSRLRKPVASAV